MGIERLDLTRLVLVGTGSGYILSTLGYTAYATIWRKKLVGAAAWAVLILTFALHTAFLGLRIQAYWMQNGGFVVPTASMFEVLSYLSWMIVLVYLVGEYILKSRLFGALVVAIPTLLFNYGMVGVSSQQLVDAFGVAPVAPVGLEPRPLVPALQSMWLNLHVTAMIISYAALMTAGVIGILYLVRNARENDELDTGRVLSTTAAVYGVWYLFKWYLHLQVPNYDLGARLSGEAGPLKVFLVDLGFSALWLGLFVGLAWFFTAVGHKITEQVELDDLDTLSYRFSAFGYPVLTLGVFLGAVWANESWGRFWGWDPKETWAFITWVFFTAFLHNRLVLDWKGRRSAIMVALGIAVIMLTFLGVNYITQWFGIEGLHNYMPQNA